MIRPSLLQRGDTVSIVAPSKKIAATEMQAAVKLLTEWGLSVKTGQHVFSDTHSYFSASDPLRLLDLQEALDDENTKAIFCARGGYGLTRILDYIQWDSFMKNPKWVIGFSDITALHLKLFSLGVESVHGIMPLLFSHAEATASLHALQQSLFTGHISTYKFEGVQNKPGAATGRMVGGNLSILVDAIGTPSDADYADCILVVEDVDEPVYKIDRMMMHLLRSGKLAKLRGLVVGHITGVNDTSPPLGQSVAELVVEKVAPFSFPVAFNFPSGHAFPNVAWRHGGEVTLRVSETASEMLLH
jgi:muramoyltetrapeptide carboxypeptidase